MKSSKRSVNLAMRSRRSSKLHVMLGRLDFIEEGAWADRRGGRIALLIESEDSNTVAIFFYNDDVFGTRDLIIVSTMKGLFATAMKVLAYRCWNLIR